MQIEVGVDDPQRADVLAVLQEHLRQMHEVTPEEGVFALNFNELADPSVTLFSVRFDGAVVAVAALKHLDEAHVELKSMHTISEMRGRGVARAILDHLLVAAATRGYARVSLETGNMDAFAPARALYESAGFSVCAPFGPYLGSSTSICMTKQL